MTGAMSCLDLFVTPREQFDVATAAYVSHPDVVAGTMMRSHGLKVQGKIFAMLVDDRLVVKLPRPRVVELVDVGEGEPFATAPGRVMKEWVSIGVDGASAWPGLVTESFDYVTSLIR